MSGRVKIIDLTGRALSLAETRKASRWRAKAFADAPATPALTIFFGAAPYSGHTEMHEAFWASHLNRGAASGIMLGAEVDGDWRGFRCFFEPGKGRDPYTTELRLSEEQGGNEDWDKFLRLAGEEKYSQRIEEWGSVTSTTNKEIGLDANSCFTTSIIVTDPSCQRQGIGAALDKATRERAQQAGRRLHVRIHEYILPFYLAQGYRVLTSPSYSLQGSEPFKVHFLVIDG